MEEWQKSYITENLPELIRLTEFNTSVKDELLAKNIVSQDDLEELVSDCKHSLIFAIDFSRNILD